MNVIPFEQHRNGRDFGSRLIEALTVNTLITQATIHEAQMTEVGKGAPPLGETIMINMMWNDVAQFPVGEA